MKTLTKQEKLENALIKKALGYEVEEVSEEFIVGEDSSSPSLTKRKVVTKHIPPDISAIKILLSYYDDKTFDELNNLSDEELLAERDKLILELQKLSQ